MSYCKVYEPLTQDTTVKKSPAQKCLFAPGFVAKKRQLKLASKQQAKGIALQRLSVEATTKARIEFGDSRTESRSAMRDPKRKSVFEGGQLPKARTLKP
jgi:hypothetical protein